MNNDIKIKPSIQNKSNKIIQGKLHAHVFVGRSTSGKTYLSKEIMTNEMIDVIPKENRFLISPTFDYDTTLRDFFNEENVERQFDYDHIEYVIIKLIKADRKEVDDKFYYIFDENRLVFIKKNLPKDAKPIYPQYLLYIEDSIDHLSGTSKAKGLSKLITYCRHLNIQLIINTQYYKSLSPIIRANATNFYFFATTENELSKIAEENSIFKLKKNFINYFKFITNKKYGAFRVNYNKDTMEIYDDNEPTYKIYKTIKDNVISSIDDV